MCESPCIYRRFRAFVVFGVRVGSRRFVQRLQRILQRAAIGTTGEVFVGYLQIMFLRHHLRIANPRTEDVCRERFGQLGFSGRAQIVEQLGPRFEPRPLHDPRELGAQVFLRVSIPGNDVIRAGFGQLKGIF